MKIFTESKAVPPSDWVLVGSGQSLVPRKNKLQLLAWGLVYEIPDCPADGFPSVKVMLNDGGDVDATYLYRTVG